MIYDPKKNMYIIHISEEDLRKAFSSKRNFKKFIKDTFGYDLKDQRRKHD